MEVRAGAFMYFTFHRTEHPNEVGSRSAEILPFTH